MGKQYIGRFGLAVAALLALAASGAGCPANVDPKPTALFEGVDYFRVAAVQPAPLHIEVLRVDLEAPGVSLLATPPNGAAEGETDSRTTTTFLEEFDCQAAVNASPFSPVVDEEGKPQDILGICVSNGGAYSSPSSKYAALIVRPGNKAACVRDQKGHDDLEQAVGGFYLALEKGKVVGTDGPRHPRTAAGVSKDGRYLYLAVFDGRQPGYSAGATTQEVGEWMKHFGAWDAVNLDGGGSSAMVVEQGDGSRALNRPIHKGVPGQQRPVANHFGVFARPLGKTDKN